MKCIFCKNDTSQTRSIEHIIPQSLGNEEHILPRGTVCDSCNNYFARKIENPVLSSGMFKLLRAERNISNKKGRIPAFDKMEIAELPDYRMFTRFIGKIGLEVLAHKTYKVENWNEEIVNHDGLNQLRSYVRFNVGDTWPMLYRTLYAINSVFKENEESFEVLHEFDLLYTNRNELYIVVVILGVEFVLNLGYPTIDGYQKWIKKNRYKSYLYSGKNA